MNKKGRKLLFKFKLITLTIVLSVLSLSHATAAGSVMPGTFDCELNLPNQKTDSFLIACADGNTELYKIKWKTWTMKGALGYGQYVYNDCKPYCAAGHDHFFKVAVSLSKLRYFRRQPYFTYINWWATDKGGKKLPGGMSGGWDLYQNFLMMGGKI